MSPTESTHAKPRPALINWLGYFALALLLALPAAVMTVRAGAWQQGLLLYAISCLGAAIVLLLAMVLLLLSRLAPWRRAIAGRALFAIPGTLLLLSLLGARGYPPIHDISTDLEDPPVFTAAGERRGTNSNSLQTDLETLSLQAEAYPQLQTLRLDASFDEVFNRAVQIATAMGWDLYLQDRNAGVIEAVDTTAVMNFKDDIVIRVRTNADGTLVDLRSVSRVGVSDLGANARRVSAFLDRLQQD